MRRIRPRVAAIGISITPLRYLSALLLGFMAAVSPDLQGQAAPTLTPAALTVAPGSTMTFTVANGPGNAWDWVALHRTTDPDGTFVDWVYLSGTRTQPAPGLTTATIQLTVPATPGTYNARLFANNTYTKLATSNVVTAVAPPPSITAASTTVSPGSAITFTVANAPGSGWDWVALHKTTDPDTTFVDWVYLSGTRTLPAPGLTTTTIQLTAPATPGTYNARLFANNTYTKLATSNVVTVAAPPPSITAASATVSSGSAITFTVANAPGSGWDWVALHRTTDPDGTFVDWVYLSGTRTDPAPGLTTTTIQLTAPATPGTYDARLFANNTYTKLATSGTVTVTDDPAPLVAAYSYNDGAGTTAADVSVNNNTAAISGTTWSTACKFGKCLSFNGTSFVESADIEPLALATDATFEAWVRLSTAPAETASIFNKWSQTADDEYIVGISPARALYFAWQTTGGGAWPSPSFNEAASTSTIPLNTLTHVAVVRSGATLTFYINGTPGTSLTVLDANPFRNGATSLRVGGQGRGARNRFFPGVIDETRIYNRALTQAEIQADMNAPIGPDTTPPVLSAISASAVASLSATIGWTTNESSDTQIEYGLTTAYGSATPLTSSLLTDHSVTVGALLPITLHHYRVRSRDAAGNLAVSGDHTFTTTAVDLTPPTVSLTAPAANAAVSGVVTVSANAADNVGVVGVQFKLDGADLGFMDTAAPYAITWDTTAASVGAHTLTAVARDAAGNQRTSTAIVVTVSQPQVRLAWDASTDVVAGYRVYVGFSPGVYFTSLDAGDATTYTVTDLEAGRLYYFAVTAYDQDGNESSLSNEVSTTTP